LPMRSPGAGTATAAGRRARSRRHAPSPPPEAADNACGDSPQALSAG
jgi:hypothetical protein